MNNLSETQLRFYHLIKPYPRLAALWDWNKRDVDLKALEKEINVMSKGEKPLAYFFASVWLGDDQGFDILDAAGLDLRERKLIATWLLDPFWP